MKEFHIDESYRGEDVTTRGKNVVIGMLRTPASQSNRSHMNCSLEKIQQKLKEDAEEVPINVSYVFGENIVWASAFQSVSSDTPVKYLENSEGRQKSHHVWFLGQKVLEKKIAEDEKNGADLENYFVLLADDVKEDEVAVICNFLGFSEKEIKENRRTKGQLRKIQVGFKPILIARKKVLDRNRLFCAVINAMDGEIQEVPLDIDENADDILR